MRDATRRRQPCAHPPDRLADEAEFLKNVRASSAFHRPWSYPPSTPQAFREHVRGANAHDERLVVCRSEDDAIVGSFGLSQIVLGRFRNAYLGYYAFEPYAGAGVHARGVGARPSARVRRPASPSGAGERPTRQ